jgi:hypothetical protein
LTSSIVTIAAESGSCSVLGYTVAWCELAVDGRLRSWGHADAELQAEMERVEREFQSDCARQRIFNSAY